MEEPKWGLGGITAIKPTCFNLYIPKSSFPVREDFPQAITGVDVFVSIWLNFRRIDTALSQLIKGSISVTSTSVTPSPQSSVLPDKGL